MQGKETASMLDKALDMFLGDMDDVEGHAAMDHSLEECEDPANCSMHDKELGMNLAPEEEPGSPAAVEITVHKGMPSMDGKSADEEKDKDGLDLETLKKIIG